MIPVEINLSNFMCYRGEQPPLRFEGLHVACLAGENGAGKSALLDAITWALWGKSRMKSDDELIAQHETAMVVDFSFMLNGQLYRVIRRYEISHKSKRSTVKTTLDLQLHDGDKWKAIGAPTKTETERSIEDLLRMSYDTFINSSYLIQGRADEFTRNIPSKRKQVLADILDLQDYAVLEERAKKRVKQLEEQVGRLDGIIAHLQHQAEKAPLYQQYVQDGEARVAALTNQLAAAEQAQAQADDHVRTLDTKLARRKELARHMQKTAHDKQQQTQEAATLQAAIDAAQTLLQRREAITAGMAEWRNAQTEVDRLDNLRPRFDALMEERRQHQDALKDVLRDLQSKKQGWQDEANRLRNALTQRPTLETDRQTYEDHLAKLAPLTDQLAAVREQLTALDVHIGTANLLILRQSELANTIAQQQHTLTANKQQHSRDLERLQRQREQAAQWQKQLDDAHTAYDKLQQLEATLADLKAQDQTITDSVSTQRANCDRYKQQADDIKQRQELLHQTATATTCPL